MKITGEMVYAAEVYATTQQGHKFWEDVNKLDRFKYEIIAAYLNQALGQPEEGPFYEHALYAPVENVDYRDLTEDDEDGEVAHDDTPQPPYDR
jgi:hypothetical protein